MKTSHILLIISAVVALTGMVATNVLFKQRYEAIDWRNPYQDFVQKPLPGGPNVVIDATPGAEIIFDGTAEHAQALVEPESSVQYRVRQRGDTIYITFLPKYRGQNVPKNEADWEQNTGLVLRLPNLQSLRVTDGRVTLRHIDLPRLNVALWRSRLRTEELNITEQFNVAANQGSYATFRNDRYASLQVSLRDSSGLLLNDTQVQTFQSDISPKADVRLSGQAVKWLK